jgi:hypothetical protein
MAWGLRVEKVETILLTWGSRAVHEARAVGLESEKGRQSLYGLGGVADE